MKAKKHILKVLLSAFLFIVVHDFVLGYIDTDTQTNLYMQKIEEVALCCDTSLLHELIHQALMSTDKISSALWYEQYSKTWVSYDIDKAFSSLLKYIHLRPPIV